MTIGDVRLDFSGVNVVTVGDGKMLFSPPAKVLYDGPGLLNIGTTVTEISVVPSGEVLLIDLNRSPVDVEVIPNEYTD